MKIEKILLLSCVCWFCLKMQAQTLYVNGRVITVDSADRILEAVAVADGKILAVGSTAQVLTLQTPKSTIIDLAGKTMIPGFIDGHSHFLGLFSTPRVYLGSPPMGEMRDINDLVNALVRFQQERNLALDEWVLGFGYDQDQLTEGRHPTKKELDKAFPNTPVFILNINGHMGVANSAALHISGVDMLTPNPTGGAIEKDAQTGELTGLLQENAKALLAIPPETSLSLEKRLVALDEQQLLYASHGITTAQEGLTNLSNLKLLQEASNRQRLFIDIESLPAADYLEEVMADTSFVFGELKNHLKLAGAKLIADGSPQGKTAYFSEPYLTEVPGCDHGDCVGFPTIDQQQFNAFILKTFQQGIRPFVHCNGDATIDMYLQAIDYANARLGIATAEYRPVSIHSQFVRPDQLDRYYDLGVIPAFFSNHAFFWGDVHVRNLGVDRASFLSPLKSVRDRGIIATNHTDYPVTPVNQLFLLWTAINRETRSGQIIGADERLTVLEALRTVTINGAYQYHEEAIKGSIEPGKLADLVILSHDITQIDPSTLRHVEVLETIKQGKTIYNQLHH